MIYTTYLAQMKNLPGDALIIIVMQYLPQWTYKMLGGRNSGGAVVWKKELAPQKDLLNAYKHDEISWEEFAQSYNATMHDSAPLRNLSKKIANENRDVYLVCCEKDNLHCHRSLLLSLVQNALADSSQIGGEWMTSG